MKGSVLSVVSLLPLALATAVPRSEKIDYKGYKGLRVTVADNDEDVLAQISKLATTVMNPGAGEELDLAVAPENIDAITELAADTTVLVEDLGAAFAEEDTATIYAGKTAIGLVLENTLLLTK